MNNKNVIHTKYKATDIGKFPLEWEIGKIKDFGDVITGSTPITSDATNYGDEYLFISPADLSERKYIKDSYKKLSTKGYEIARKIDKGSILFTCIGSTIGKMGIASRGLTCNQQINAIICKKTYSNEYLYYTLKYNVQRIKLLAGEQAVPIINKRTFENIKIPIPPYSEQQKISDILSLWDKAIEKQSQLISQLELRKKGLMQQLLTGKKRLHGFKGEWKTKKLQDVCELRSNYTISREQMNPTVGSISSIHYGDILIKYPNILDAEMECIPYINDEISINITFKSFIEDGDIIMADTAEDETVGRACEVINVNNRKLTAGLHTFLIHPKIKFAKGFLGYYINSETYHKQIIPLIQGIKVSSLTRNGILNTNICIPSIEEQEKITNILLDADNEINNANIYLSKLRMQKKGLMQQLLTGKKRIN